MLDTLASKAQRPQKEHRLRRLLILLLVLGLLGGALGVGAAWYSWAIGASGPQRPIELVIPQGASGGDVAELLEQEGVIRSTLAFKLLARFRGFSGGFQAGKYTNLTTNMAVEDVLEALKEGPTVDTIRVTVPEGLRIEEMAREVQEQTGIRRREFVEAAQSGEFSLPPYLPEGKSTVEGFLFPETYQFLKDATAADVIERLLRQFGQATSGLPWDRAERLGLSEYETVIVASLIEEEARHAPDRPKIARVIYNRLREGMLLQIDATIQYALNKKEITLEDREVENPYNTYLHAGLPPTPIASPGRASLEAALSPARGNWLYYVLIDCDTGEHFFADSLDEFNQARARAPDC